MRYIVLMVDDANLPLLSDLRIDWAVLAFTLAVSITDQEHPSKSDWATIVGASRSRVVMEITVRAVTLAAIGIVLGLAATFAVSRMLADLLFGVTPTDPATLGVVGLPLLVVSIAAAARPALRAAKVDPATTLRAE